MKIIWELSYFRKDSGNARYDETEVFDQSLPMKMPLPMINTHFVRKGRTYRCYQIIVDYDNKTITICGTN